MVVLAVVGMVVASVGIVARFLRLCLQRINISISIIIIVVVV